MAISADGTTAITGDTEGYVLLWDLCGDGESRVLDGPLDPVLNWLENAAPVRAVAISADGTTAISGRVDGSVQVWDLVEERCIASWIGDYPITGCSVLRGPPLKIGLGQSHGAPYMLELRGAD